MKRKFFSSKPVWKELIFVARAVTGLMIARFGLELFNPAAMKDLIHFLTDMNIPIPEPMAYIAKITEFFGGILLIAGLFTRFITPPLAITMIVVIMTMGGGSIFNDQSATLFLLLFTVFFCAGPGKWSLDYFFFDRPRKSTINKI